MILDIDKINAQINTMLEPGQDTHREQRIIHAGYANPLKNNCYI